MADFKRGGGKGGFKKGGFGGGSRGGFKPRGEGGYKPREGSGEGSFERKPRRDFGDAGGERPRREGGFKPRGEGGYKPREGGFKPRGEGGYKPRGEGGFDRKPRRDFGEGGGERGEGGFKPRGEGGFKPRGEGGYQRREGGFKPRGEGGYDRKPREGGGGYGRKSYGESRPPRNYGERDSGGYKPRREGGFKPRGEGGYERKPYGERSEGGYKPREERGPREGGFRERGPRGGQRETHWVEKDPYESAPNSDGWLVGKHPVMAALTAGRRVVKEVWMASDESEVRAFQAQYPEVRVKTVSRLDLEKRFPGQVHQGMAAEVGNLPQPDLADILAQAPRLMVGVDQVTDPHNFGAILRSCAAFGVGAVVATERRSAGVTSVVAKAAAGALEVVPVVDVTNLVTSLNQIKDAGYTVVGLAGEAELTLAEAKLGGKVCVVMGSEGDGLRRLTRETCDVLVKIPMTDVVESLNVSVAAGVVLAGLYAPAAEGKPAKAAKPAKAEAKVEAKAEEAPAKVEAKPRAKRDFGDADEAPKAKKPKKAKA